MSITFFKLEIQDVKNPNGDTTWLDITNCVSKENMLDELADDLDCQTDELNFDDAYIDAEEDFLLDLLDVNEIYNIKDSTFDNISAIENSGYSLDVFEAAVDVLSSSDDFDNVLNHIRNNYIGKYNDDADFAESYSDDLSVPTILQGCIDWDQVWETSLRMDHSESNGHYFRD